MIPDRFIGAVFVTSAAILWGSLGLVARIVYDDGISVEAVVFVRAGGAFLVILAFILLTGRTASLRVGSRDLLSLVPLGVVAIGCFYLLYFYTIRESEVGTAAVLLYSSPAFVVVLARIFLGEALSLFRVAALFLTAAGIGLVVGVYDLASLDVRPFVILTGTGAGFAYGTYSVVGKSLTRRLPPHTIIFYILGIGASVLFVAALPTLDTLAGLSAGAYIALAASVLFQTALAYALYTAGLKRIEAGQASILATIEVVAAGLVGAVFLAEEITALKILGATFVISGAVLAQVRLRRSPRKNALSPGGGAGRPR